MSDEPLQIQIAREAARLLFDRQETEYFRAKLKAARRLGHGWVQPDDMPTNAAIRDQWFALVRLGANRSRSEHLLAMRLTALGMMRRLRSFRPRLSGSLLTGQIRRGSSIELELFADVVDPIVAILVDDGYEFEVSYSREAPALSERRTAQLRVHDQYPIRLTIQAEAALPGLGEVDTGEIKGARLNIREFESLLEREHPEQSLAEGILPDEATPRRFEIYQGLLLALEAVKLDPRTHPEGDALYHSLQVFDLASRELPYDEEFLLAALLHDVGLAIDIESPVQAGLSALEGTITPRTAWLIDHQFDAQSLLDGTLGQRHVRRLQGSEFFDSTELKLLALCDRQGRARGVEAPDLDEALDYLRELADDEEA